MTTIAFNGEFANDYCPDPVSALPLTPTRSHTFLKIAAAVLLGALILTPLAYYRLPPGDHNSNNAAIVDSPDITLEDGQTTPLTETTITEIENLIKELQLDKAQILLTGALHKAQDSKDQATLSALLRLQGRILGEKADFQGAIQALNQAITIAQSLNNKQLLLGPVINLTNIYHVTDQNAEAAKQAKYCLDLARETQNIPYQIASLQMLGISKFFAYRSLDSAELVKLSIVLAENQKNYEHVVQGYIYMGVILTESRSFAEANIWFSQAITKVATIKSPQRKIYLSSTINGHQARCKTLSGQYSEALKLYNSSIIQARQAGVKQYLALSQLQRGLSKCYLKLGESKEAEKAEAKAEVFELEAQERCETGNTAMSFAPVQKVAKRCN
jgi:tetratricopeptide (TPR) repeat protein